MSINHNSMVFLLSFLHVSEGLRMQLASSETQKKTAHIYVMTLPERKDRCGCMQNQLAAYPFPAFLLNATSPGNLQKHCPDVKNHHEPELNDKRRCVFCSNRQVLEAAKRNPEKPDCIIIMEDDRAINQQGFWTHVQNFLNRDCSQKDFDM
eukprot:gnl/MRDRNA2_/MRDRNA2_112140_c0_seq1.p1 gnl/MRDRNA2_/MRDRNA2_112140_c0~~gnl/MRDRNA2_/MRDRNA2_112140_c0_seq1.p1  ORF type:complete len:151 (+),score=22.66 gnl/MRDRNA2_/MRDRNA2_112140_c0_seq1:73-525(+)